MIKTICHTHNLKRERKVSLCCSSSALAAAHLDKEQDDNAGFSAGERPPGRPLLWPLLGPALSLRVRSTSASDTHHKEIVQGHCQAGISSYNQPAINVAAEEPPVNMTPSMVFSPSFSVFSSDYEVIMERSIILLLYLFPVFSIMLYILTCCMIFLKW